MKSTKVIIKLLILIFSLCTIGAVEFDGEEIIGENFETLDGDIDKTWGSINDESVMIGRGSGFSRTDTVGNIARLNVSVSFTRIIDGLRLRSVNNTGAVGDLIEGGVGYTFARFMLVGHSNYFTFLVDAYENYTSSLLPNPTTPIPDPDIIIAEWGTINYASKIIYPRESYHEISEPGQTIERIFNISSTRIMDGIRLTSFEDSVASGEIINGGIGFNFATIKVVSKYENVSYLIEKYENGTYTELPTTTTLSTTTILSTSLLTTTEGTTPKPEEDVKEWGKTDNDTKLSEKRFSSYPEPNVLANKNETFEVSGTILGMRLKSLNNTNGLWELIGGGLNESFVTFNFKGASTGRAYDFNVEIFGNSASAIKMSIFAIMLSSILFALLK